MKTFKQMETILKEAGRLMEVARINQKTLTAHERTFVSEARALGSSSGLSEPMIQSYLEEGAEVARVVLR